MNNYFLLFVSLFVLNFNFSQEKIKFRDGITLPISGEKITSKTRYQDGKITQKEHFYYSRKENEITISIYSVWESGSMDFLKVYTFNMSQLRKITFYDVVEFGVDEYNSVVYYSFPLVTDSETPFLYDLYDSYTSVPKKNSFVTFSIESDEKNALEKFHKEIYNLFPEEVEEQVEGE